ncbi:argininosuccinate lyase, partial [Staphylococcus cohnii]
KEYQNAHTSIDADIYDFLKPENCVSRRISYGSTGQAAVEHQLSVIKQQQN